MSEPIVSVVIATRNRAAMLKEAIASVGAQTYQDWELIVVDDGSTDQTKRVAQQAAKDDPRVHYLRQPARGGVSKARNAGIHAARGRYIAFLDDDDQFVAEKLATQVVHLDRSPEVGFVYAQSEWVDRRGTSLGVQPTAPVTDLKGLVEHCAIPLQTVMCRRELIERVGGFDERLSIGEDYDLWLRLARITRFEFVARPLVRYGVHGANTCNDSIRLYEQRAIILARVPLDRARGITWWFKRRRLAINAYRLARLHHEARAFAQASAHFARAVVYDPMVGLAMAEPRPRGLARLWVSLKPYLAIVLLLIGVSPQARKVARSPDWGLTP
ncbi:MAG: glycosyltransferase [Candidatus Omnitrophica bacterium]|nr:glycosyltransferase [Candidatus Omnitrophota bacterium]